MNELAIAWPTLGGKQLWGDRLVYEGYRIQRNVLTGHHRLLGPGLGRHTWGSYDECRQRFDRVRAEQQLTRPSRHLVVLLHGIFRAAEAWRPMERGLRDAGFATAPVTYPSTRRSLEDHADLVDDVLNNSDDVDTVSFVAHSMGGLVAREVLGREGGWRERIAVNRLVMIATPNRGAVLADRLVPLQPLRRAVLPVAQLTTDYVTALPHPSCPFGLVIGVRGDGKGYNPLLPGDDDMTVSEHSARLPGAEDELLLAGAIHTLNMRDERSVSGVVRYLNTGRFSG